MWHRVDGDYVLGRPIHGGGLWSGRGFIRVGVRRVIVQNVVGVKSLLMGPALVFDHGGLSTKALQAAVMTTFVRSLPSVDSSVTSETGRVRKAFAASNMLALVRLLTGVCSDVDSQGASLDEALPTAWGRARVRSLIGVNSIMSLQVRLAIEALVARLPVTLERASRRLILNKFQKLHGEVLKVPAGL